MSGGRVIAEYISPELTGKPAPTALGVVRRRMNTAARKVWARGTPFAIDEIKRARPEVIRGQGCPSAGWFVVPE